MEFLERLSDIRQTFETGETPQSIIDVLNAHVDDLLSQNWEASAVGVDQVATLSLPVWNSETSLPLSDLMGERFMVLTWFRGNW